MGEFISVRPPDRDGYLTLGEAKWQWQNGRGTTIYVDLNRLDLSAVSVADFPMGPGSLIPFRTSMPDFVVYGTITLQLDPASKSVSARNDTYNFDIKPWSSDTFTRNISTIGGRFYVGPGTPFNIEFRGNVLVPPR